MNETGEVVDGVSKYSIHKCKNREQFLIHHKLTKIKKTVKW